MRGCERVVAQAAFAFGLAMRFTLIDRITAIELGKSVGSVYAARSRVMRRLKQKVREWDESGAEVVK